MGKVLFIEMTDNPELILAERKKEGLILLERKELTREDLKDLKDKINSGLLALKTPLIYLSLPVESFRFRIIEVPFKEEHKIRDVIPFELREKVMEDPENLVYDFIRLSESEKNQKILIVSIKKDDLTGIIKGLSEQGLEADVISSLGLRHIIDKDFKVEDLLNPPQYRDNLPGLIEKEAERPLINLLKGTFGLTVEKEGLMRRLRITNVLLFVLLLSLALSFFTTIRKDHSEALRLKTWINNEYRKEFPEERIKDEVLQLKAHLKELREKREILLGLPVVETLKNIRPPEAIKIEQIEMESKNIMIKGEGSDLSVIEVFKERLKETFPNPSITESTQFSGKIRFTIKAKR